MRPSGAVDCWGSNDKGQAEDQLGPYAALAVGESHNCAVLSSGAVDCWGSTTYGESEDQAGLYVYLSAGVSLTCALTEQGAADCWGDNSYGEGDDQLGPYSSISAGDVHTCALRRPSGAADCWSSYNPDGQAEDQPGPYTAISTGTFHTCALTEQGAADCWGDNDNGEAEDQAGPFTAISAGYKYTCALTLDGAVDCWGRNGDGQAADQPGPYGAFIDSTPPTASPQASPSPNAAGWNTSAVTVSWNWSDNPGGSGLDIDTDYCPATDTLRDEGVQGIDVTCQDRAGNTATASYTVKIDTTQPTLAPLISPNPVPLGATATVSANPQDALSGIASASCGALDTATPGVKSVTCTATDRAGNTASAGVQYTVAYRWSGFFQPVDNLPTVNQVKAGSAVPVKFSLGGNYGLAIFAQGFPASQAVACNTSAPIDDIEQTVTAGASGLQYDSASQQYSYVWKTDKSWSGTCRRLVLRLNDGTEHVALFRFK